jgi:hypothetical protein
VRRFIFGVIFLSTGFIGFFLAYYARQAATSWFLVLTLIVSSVGAAIWGISQINSALSGKRGLLG